MKLEKLAPVIGVVGGLILVAVFGMMFIFGGVTPERAAIAQETTEELKETLETVADLSVCDDDGRGELRAAIFNPLNESATEYIAATARLYEVSADGTENYKGPITLATSGLPAIGSGTTLTCFTPDNKLKQYRMYVTASDGSHTSGYYDFTAELDTVIEMAIPQQGVLVAKVYDNNEHGGVYGDTETSTSTYIASTGSFYSITGNATTDSTGTTVGTNGDFDYTMTVYTASATDVQFTDQSQLIAIDRQDRTDWEEIMIGIESTTVNIETLDSCPSKISSDAYDDCYELTQGGEPLVIGSGTDKRKVSVEGNAKSGVNPTDDVKVGFGTKGWYKETVGSDVKLDYNKDDSSETYVYTMQSWTLVFHSS